MKEECRGNWRGDNWVHILCDEPVPHAAHEIDIEKELSDCPGSQCLYELGGIYCPECHRGD